MQPRPDELERDAQLVQQRLSLLRREGGELEQHRQVVGQLGVGHRQPGLGVASLQPDELEPALPAVAVGVVREVEGRAPVEVERQDVGGLELAERRVPQIREEAVEPRLAAGGPLELVLRRRELGARVLEQDRESCQAFTSASS